MDLLDLFIITSSEGMDVIY